MQKLILYGLLQNNSAEIQFHPKLSKLLKPKNNN